MALAAARHAAQDRHLAPGDAGEPSALYGFTNNFAAYDVKKDSPGTRPVSKKLLKIICDRRACISQRSACASSGSPSHLRCGRATLATPVIGVVATVLVLGERPSTADIVGFALIFTASACVVFAPLLRAKSR